MRNIFLVLVSLIFLSCNNNNEPTPIPFVPVTITPLLIGKRNDKAPTEGISKENFIINDETNWINLKNKMDAPYIEMGLGNYYTENHFEETNINFNNFTIIAVFDQIYNNGGHSIDITDIKEYENYIIVTVKNLQTGNASSVYTQPYHIVKIPKTNKPIIFQ